MGVEEEKMGRTDDAATLEFRCPYVDSLILLAFQQPGWGNFINGVVLVAAKSGSPPLSTNLLVLVAIVASEPTGSLQSIDNVLANSHLFGRKWWVSHPAIAPPWDTSLLFPR